MARADKSGGDQAHVVDTLGGRMHVRWDEGAAATPHGQLVYFAEFLAATGVFERWVSACPLTYRSGNAPDKRDVLGTLMMGMLAGHRRYVMCRGPISSDKEIGQKFPISRRSHDDRTNPNNQRAQEGASSF